MHFIFAHIQEPTDHLGMKGHCQMNSPEDIVSGIHHKSRSVCCQVQHYPCRGVNLYLLHLQSLRKDYMTVMSAGQI